jgi:hypothetical protein
VLARGNVLGVMALLASESSMFPFQWVACLVVIERFLGGFPMDDLEVCAVVFGMAADALVVVRLLHQTGVIAAAVLESLGNFSVAFQALEALISAAETMAGGTLCSPAQRLMGP